MVRNTDGSSGGDGILRMSVHRLQMHLMLNVMLGLRV